MRRAEVLMHGIPAGILEELETGRKYRFIFKEFFCYPPRFESRTVPGL
jgi:hypothetical protein